LDQQQKEFGKMSFTVYTPWATNDVVAASKLNQMRDNEIHNRSGHSRTTIITDGARDYGRDSAIESWPSSDRVGDWDGPHDTTYNDGINLYLNGSILGSGVSGSTTGGADKQIGNELITAGIDNAINTLEIRSDTGSKIYRFWKSEDWDYITLWITLGYTDVPTLLGFDKIYWHENITVIAHSDSETW
jgi:hypothetical protein